MEKLTLNKIKSDIKDIIKTCGKEIYMIQFIMVLYNIYNTYNLYITYPNKNITASFSEALITIIDIILTAILTIIVITIINNNYEKVEYNYKEVFITSIKKLPRFVLGYLIISGILFVALLIFAFMYIILRVPIFSFILVFVLTIAFIYILIRFCLANYILILEKDSGLVARSKELYMRDKGLMIKYFIVALLSGMIPAILFIFLPDWLGMELSRTAFLITRLILNAVGFILTPIINIVGLTIYKHYI